MQRRLKQPPHIVCVGTLTQLTYRAVWLHPCVALCICALCGCVCTTADLWPCISAFVFLIISCASASHRKVGFTATPPLSWRRWSWSHAPFTRRRRGWLRTALETTARIHSLWVTPSSARSCFYQLVWKTEPAGHVSELVCSCYWSRQ